jgi:hypothetical protein
VFWEQSFDFFGVSKGLESRKFVSNRKVSLLKLPVKMASAAMFKRLKLGVVPEIDAKDYVLQNVFE